MHLAHSLLDFLERLRRRVGLREGAAEGRLTLLHCFQGRVEEIENLLKFVKLKVHSASSLHASAKRFVTAYQGGDLRLNLADLEWLLLQLRIGVLIWLLLGMTEIWWLESIVILMSWWLIIILFMLPVILHFLSLATPIATACRLDHLFVID